MIACSLCCLACCSIVLQVLPQTRLLVVATLLGFDVELVLGVSHEKATCRIWNKITSIPGRLPKYAIFAQTPQLKSPGNRWASRSFMNSTLCNLTACYAVHSGTESHARPTPRAVFAAYPVFLFRLVSGWRPLCIFGYNGNTREVKFAPSSLSPSPTRCRYNL
jgi:hypothetical protein